MANTRGNDHEAEAGNETWVSDSAPKDTPPTVAQTERSDAWKAADAARAKANDLVAEAQKSVAEANELEAKATASDEEVEYVAVDPLAGTWEASVSGGAAPADAPADAGEDGA